MIIIKGGVTAPNGFLANSVRAGIKKSGRPDLAILYSEVPAVAAGAFTRNRFAASPVKVSKSHLCGKTHAAIIVNSGNANCANGRNGDRDALAMADLAARIFSIDKREVLVASTGIIGKILPIDKIRENMPELAMGLSRANGRRFAEAIMTTDTKKKEMAVKFKAGKAVITIGGACKGVGMIYPDMKPEKHATMLSFITTDAAISKKMLEAALGEAVDGSFNMISVDGDMSTNDSCFILANGLAGNKTITKKDGRYKSFTLALAFLARGLAKMLAADGEGATKFVEIEVRGAACDKDAKAVARKISASNLLKCCIFGEDPNWGRVIAAAGSSGVDFDPDKVDVCFGGIRVMSSGVRADSYDAGALKKYFKNREIHIKVDLKSGKKSATAWTCDLSKEYVAINSEYST